MENNQKTEKISFYTERKSALVQASVIFMLLSAIFRLVGCWGRWNDAFFAATQIALPLACNLLFILLVLTLGRRALWTTVLPVLLGVVFFIIKSFTFDSVLHTILCIQKGISHLTDLRDIGTFSDLKPVCISSVSGRIKGIGNDNLLSRIPFCRRIRKVMCGRIKG